MLECICIEQDCDLIGSVVHKDVDLAQGLLCLCYHLPAASNPVSPQASFLQVDYHSDLQIGEVLALLPYSTLQ